MTEQPLSSRLAAVLFIPPKKSCRWGIFCDGEVCYNRYKPKNFQKIKNFPKKHPRKSVIISEGQNLHERSDPRDHRRPPTSPQR